MTKARESLERLVEGNRRFAQDLPSKSALDSSARRSELLGGQQPSAIILGCSDSRVPAEIVFDQGLGDLFVIRVAGNIVAPSQVGSVEFAAEQIGVQLVVVMGHSSCGAIEATVDQLERPGAERSPNLSSIVERIRPTVETLMESGLVNDRQALIRAAVRANVRTSVDHLCHGSAIIERLVANDELLVVGAEYSLETGYVDFFDRMPGSD
ncbi:MAG: carbonic anhydrase [Verrucomicrobiales bacterium]